MLMGTEVKCGKDAGFGVVRGDCNYHLGRKWEGMVLQILLKILFHLEQDLQWDRPTFAFQRNGGEGRHGSLDLEGPTWTLVLTSVPLHASIHPFPTWIWIWRKPQAKVQMEHLEICKQFWLWNQLIVWLWAKPSWGSQSFHLSICLLKMILSVFAYVARILCQLNIGLCFPQFLSKSLSLSQIFGEEYRLTLSRLQGIVLCITSVLN